MSRNQSTPRMASMRYHRLNWLKRGGVCCGVGAGTVRSSARGLWKSISTASARCRSSDSARVQCFCLFRRPNAAKGRKKQQVVHDLERACDEKRPAKAREPEQIARE